MTRNVVHTELAPAAVGSYSQAVTHAAMVFLSGQIALDPKTMQLVNDTIEDEIHQVFRNLAAVATAAGSSLQRALKMTIFLTDPTHYAKVNEIMAGYCGKPFPARATVVVAALPRGAHIEVDAILALD